MVAAPFRVRLIEIAFAQAEACGYRYGAVTIPIPRHDITNALFSIEHKERQAVSSGLPFF
ncbi:MAG: hypothetical protein JXD19_10875 [Deltaproteobacteria bacterium]|nr:hypothetical protein [Deltaproteobacteria bacterium]